MSEGRLEREEVIAVAGDDPLMVVDGSGIVVQWSRQAEAILGRGTDEVLGRSITPWLARTAAVADQQAEPGRDEVALCDASGHVVAKDLRVRPLPRQDGSLDWGLFQARAFALAAHRWHTCGCGQRWGAVRDGRRGRAGSAPAREAGRTA
ncbi:PAS domain-containing protein [Streptomyces sp. NPDC004546]|uniref:PAS domain-containing protein n=1 Tax=Streptomyces sp. NPDC004546 TaxID=3154282 RepID=UPI0033B3024A